MEEEASDMDTKQRPFSSKVITFVLWVVVCVLLVPLTMASLLAWTILGRLCRLGSRTIFVMLLVLVLIPPLVEPTPFARGLKYTFGTSLLDPVCVLVATYALYMFALLWSHETSAAVADRRRIVILPVAIGVGSFFLMKLSILSRTDDTARWKVAWLWVCFLWSVFVYVSMSRWWTDSSIPRLALAEETLMNKYAQVEFDQSVVAGLGTLTVRDPSASGWGPTSQEAGPSKPVLVLVHGYAAGNAFWMFVLKGLSQHFRVACVEMFGCGRSERLPFKAKDVVETERLLVECLEKWRAEMGIEEMVLCGHSLGGMAVAAYAMEHPHRLKMLILASPAGVGGISMDGDGGSRGSLVYKVYSFLWNRGFGPLGIVRWSGPFGRRMARMLIARRLSWVPETAKIREVDSALLGDYIFQLLALPASGEKIIFPLLNPDLHAYRPLLETLRGNGGGGRAVEKRGVSCPVSIIYGEPGIDWMPTRHGVDLVERLKNEGIRGRVYTVSEAGHTLIIDNPDGFTRVFLDAFGDARLSNDQP